MSRILASARQSMIGLLGELEGEARGMETSACVNERATDVLRTSGAAEADVEVTRRITAFVRELAASSRLHAERGKTLLAFIDAEIAKTASLPKEPS